MEDFIEGLKKVEQDLAYYICPKNKNGFVKSNCDRRRMFHDQRAGKFAW